MKERNRKSRSPNVYTILLLLAIVPTILTWIVSARSYERVTEGNITRVVADTHHEISQNPQGPWKISQALVTDFKDQSSLIYMILFVGVAVYTITETKAIGTIFMKLIKAVEGREEIAILCVIFFMSLGGATGVLGNVALVLIPIGIFLSQAMGFDKIPRLSIIFFRQFVGFNVGQVNVGVLGVVQSIVEVPLFFGSSTGVTFHIVNFTLSYAFVIFYLHQIEKDPFKSLDYE